MSWARQRTGVTARLGHFTARREGVAAPWTPPPRPGSAVSSARRLLNPEPFTAPPNCAGNAAPVSITAHTGCRGLGASGSSPAGDGEPDGLRDRPGTRAQDAGREDERRRIKLGERQAGRWTEATSPGPGGNKGCFPEPHRRCLGFRGQGLVGSRRAC